MKKKNQTNPSLTNLI